MHEITYIGKMSSSAGNTSQSGYSISLVRDHDKPSPCQLACHAEQKSLVLCMNSIKENGDNSCLKSAVNEWTKCCAEANTLDEDVT